MKKILVIGCPGSGKSTFARRLRDRTGLPLYHLDLLWHRPDKTTVSEAEFDAALAVFHFRAKSEAYEIPAAEA